MPPHLGCTDHDRQIIIQEIKKTHDYRFSDKIQLLTSGSLESHSFDIGFPSPLSEATSTLTFAKSQYNDIGGVLYFRYADFKKDTGEKYLQKYFKSLHQLRPGEKCQVILNENLENSRAIIEKIAIDESVDVVFSKKIPRIEFEYLLKKIGSEGGLIGTDGIQTAMQACLFETPFFEYLHDAPHNKSFFSHFADGLDKSLQQDAYIVFGLTDGKVSVQKHKEVTMAAKKLLLARIERFENVQKKTRTPSRCFTTG